MSHMYSVSPSEVCPKGNDINTKFYLWDSLSLVVVTTMTIFPININLIMQSSLTSRSVVFQCATN